MSHSRIGSWNRNLREARNWSQTQVGPMLGVSQASVSHWETGKAMPGDQEIRQLEVAERFGKEEE